MANYINLYCIYKFALETKLENNLENKKGRWQAFGPVDPAAQRGTWPTRETTHIEEPAQALKQMSPQTFPEPQLGPNTISSFLW